MAKERDYKREYELQLRRGDDVNNAKRHKARREMEKKKGRSAIAGKDIDHKRRLASGGSNDDSNLQVADPSENRSRNGQRPGMKKPRLK